ncbi:APC family permease [Solirubrobacter deserti]|uniref:Amino acid permease n=1 Tax=Solirubrobacter deserti TaxID=2282478 RepID=A0ABT4RBM4_9ACTN|nr:amino acid permease [Solirubrobacter deserti]MDA0135923.1 amino acid permease [Solirubrobacter deserti]
MTTVTEPFDVPKEGDAQRLNELGYEQELKRGMGIFDSVAMGFATISPVVGLYAVALIGMVVAGAAWVWVLPVALAGQCLLMSVYAELAGKFPLANGAYQWSRRLVGPRYGWFNGWVALCAYAVANTTIAYLGAPWALTLLGITATPAAIVITGAVLVLVCSVINAFGVDALKGALRLGVGAEAIASIGVGLALLLVFREQDFAVLFDSFGTEALSGGSTFAALLAALAVGGWAFIGFDATVAAAEETKGAAKHVPRAVWIALLSVGALVILNAFATTLAHPNPADVAAGKDLDPVSTAVVASFGGWASKPFAAVVLLAFIACGMAAQGGTARGIYSMARDGVLPGSKLLRTVDRRQAPIGGIVATTIVAWAGLLLGLEATAIGSLITFGTAAIFVAFLLIAVAALYARTQGVLSRRGMLLNVLAVVWLAFETINIAWPRASLAPLDAPWYQVWAAPMVVAAITLVGLVYLVVARPDAR